jgi:hypothetical protein
MEEKKKGFTASGKKPEKYPDDIREQAVGLRPFYVTGPMTVRRSWGR